MPRELGDRQRAMSCTSATGFAGDTARVISPDRLVSPSNEEKSERKFRMRIGICGLGRMGANAPALGENTQLELARPRDGLAIPNEPGLNRVQ